MTTTPRLDPRLMKWLEQAPSRGVFLEVRLHLMLSPYSRDAIDHVAERMSRWPSNIPRPAPLAWLWRASRGEPCPELSICNAIEPRFLERSTMTHDDDYDYDGHYEYDQHEEELERLADLELTRGYVLDPRGPHDV